MVDQVHSTGDWDTDGAADDRRRREYEAGGYPRPLSWCPMLARYVEHCSGCADGKCGQGRPE